ncbi:nuclear transport factor 2 family protein [Budvicia aquatica]|uniref:Lumazine-binding n=1 Tax=Budvicia aquatica TaxID=82979 RepID=A0A484ZS16_9GAMM|nr:nuclear transport factor 2 family protein [Budvicia aquatica]VFS50203.1 Putative lumazine-binding [Budvicia aquatica]
MNQRTVSANEYKNVTEAATKYVEALRTGNVDMLSDVFHKDCVTYGTVNGELMGGASNPTADFIQNYGKSPEIIFHIDILDITPTTAVVRIVMEKDAVGSDCNDYLSFIKLDKRWAVISKIFHQFEK